MSHKHKPQLSKPAASAHRSPAERAAQVRQLVGDGARLLAAKRPGEAAVLLAEACELEPQNVAAAINLGGAYILQGRHEQAVPVLEAAARLEPGNPMIWSNLAAAYLGKLPFATAERQERAIAAYQRALTLDPRTPHASYNLGLIYLERDDPASAAMHFQQALDADPTDRDAQHWLAAIQRGAAQTQEPQG